MSNKDSNVEMGERGHGNKPDKISTRRRLGSRRIRLKTSVNLPKRYSKLERRMARRSGTYVPR